MSVVDYWHLTAHFDTADAAAVAVDLMVVVVGVDAFDAIVVVVVVVADGAAAGTCIETFDLLLICCQNLKD